MLASEPRVYPNRKSEGEMSDRRRITVTRTEFDLAMSYCERLTRNYDLAKKIGVLPSNVAPWLRRVLVGAVRKGWLKEAGHV